MDNIFKIINFLGLVFIVSQIGGLFWGLFVRNVYLATELTGQFRIGENPVKNERIVRAIKSKILKGGVIIDTVFTDKNGFFLLPERRSLKLGLPGEIRIIETIAFYQDDYLIKELDLSHSGKKQSEVTDLILCCNHNMLDTDTYKYDPEYKQYKAKDFTLKKNTSGLNLELFASGIVVEIDTDKKDFQQGEPIRIHFSIHNRSLKDFTYLPWQTPIDEDLTASVFWVYTHKVWAPLSYKGEKIKRPAPIPSDFITINPYITQKITLELTQYYNLKYSGYYTISYKENELNGLPRSNDIKISVK